MAFQHAFEALKPLLAGHSKNLVVQVDNPSEFTVVAAKPSPFPQHKGHPMQFASVKLGKAYASFHLMPLYMNPKLTGTITPELAKRMQGKTCFNFKSPPDATQMKDLERLTAAGMKLWKEKDWL